MIGRLFANLSLTSMYRMSVISATNVYFCRATTRHQVSSTSNLSDGGEKSPGVLDPNWSECTRNCTNPATDTNKGLGMFIYLFV